MGRWTFKLFDALPPAGVAALEELPGVRAWPKKVNAPENAATIVRGMLQAQDIGFQIALPQDPVRGLIKNCARAMPSLRKEVAGLGKFPDYLMPWQAAGLAAMLAAPNGSGLLIHPAGSGKTIASIIWALSGIGRVIVVTKAAVKYQWAGEVKRISTVTPLILEGETPTALGIDTQFVILSYEILPAWISTIEEWCNWLQAKPSVVFDESHKVSSKKRWTATLDVEKEDDGGVVQLAEPGALNPDVAGSSPATPSTSFDFPMLSEGEAGLPPPKKEPEKPKVKFTLNENIAAAAWRLSGVAGRRLLTTATPIRDRVRNLWAQLDLAHPYEWGNYWTWAKRYCAAAEGTFGGMDDSRSSHLEELRQRVEVVSHSVPHAIVNAGLPARRRSVVYLPIAAQVPSGMVNEVRKAAKSGDPTALREVLMLEACARKRPWLLGQLEGRVEGGHKVVVFTGRRKDADELMEKCRAKFTCPIFGGHGGHSAEERNVSKDRYMATPGPTILIGTTDAWGEGLNLQDSDVLYQALLPFTPGQIIQAEGRVARLGQQRPVEVIYPVCEGTIDERIAGILLTKLPALEKVIDQGEVKSFARELSGVDDTELLAGLAAKITSREKK